MPNKPVVIVLAAGKGDRFLASGGKTHKLSASLGGVEILERLLRTVETSGMDVHIVRFSPRQGGMADSISSGVCATASATGWLILPGDLPLVQPESLRRVADGLVSHKVVVPYYRGQQGHPVGFRHECFDALSCLSGEGGAKAVINEHRFSHEVLDLPVDDLGLITDVDTVDDLAKAHAIFMRTVNPA